MCLSETRLLIATILSKVDILYHSIYRYTSHDNNVDSNSEVINVEYEIDYPTYKSINTDLMNTFKQYNTLFKSLDITFLVNNISMKYINGYPFKVMMDIGVIIPVTIDNTKLKAILRVVDLKDYVIKH